MCLKSRYIVQNWLLSISRRLFHHTRKGSKSAANIVWRVHRCPLGPSEHLGVHGLPCNQLFRQDRHTNSRWLGRYFSVVEVSDSNMGMEFEDIPICEFLGNLATSRCSDDDGAKFRPRSLKPRLLSPCSIHIWSYAHYKDSAVMSKASADTILLEVNRVICPRVIKRWGARSGRPSSLCERWAVLRHSTHD